MCVTVSHIDTTFTVILSCYIFLVGVLMVLTTVCSEVAFGYKGLQIELYYTAGNLSTLFKVKYSSKVTEAFDCVEVRSLSYLYFISSRTFIHNCDFLN